MRKLAITVALATTAIAAPALARDGSPYVGVEGGVMLVEDTEYDYTDPTISIDNAYTLDHKTGWDADLVGGYDFGMFRVEGELGYKRASVDDVRVDALIANNSFPYDADGHSTAWSAMLNALLDFGDDAGGVSGFVGGGVGVARVKENFDVPELDRFFDGKDHGFAWQVVAGVRTAITPTLDLGVKYRFFNVPNLHFDADGPAGPFNIDGKWRSHSLLASLIYNFAPPPAPPPPPAAVPAPPGSRAARGRRDRARPPASSPARCSR